MSTNCYVSKLETIFPDPNKEMDYFGGVIVGITKQDPSLGISSTGVYSLHGATELTFIDGDANFGENGEYGPTTTIVHNFKFKPVNPSDPYGTVYRVFVKNPIGVDVTKNLYKLDVNTLCKYTNSLYEIQMSDYRLTYNQKGSVVKFRTTQSICTPLIAVKMALTNQEESDIDFNFAHFADNNSLREIQVGGTSTIPGPKYYGDISNLASNSLQTVSLEYYKGQENVTGTGGVYGELTSLAAAMASRTSGTCQVKINANCHTITLNGVEKTGTVTIKFGSSMVNPTAEETAQNYQIS